MKAKEYYTQCRDGLRSTDPDEFRKASGDLLFGMMYEMQQILKARHAQYNSAAIAAIKEFDQKYNAVVSLFEKEYGNAPIERNGFSLIMVLQMPELGQFFPEAQEKIAVHDALKTLEGKLIARFGTGKP
jgi:hypothetical protein